MRVFIIGDTAKLSSDCLEMVSRLEQAGGYLELFDKTADITQYLNNCSVIIDAIFGIGLNAPVQDQELNAIKLINSSNAYIISADISSGVSADTGAILGEAVWANTTVTFSMAKPGHFVEPGVTRCGELKVCDIGIPKDIIDAAVSPVFAVSADDIFLPRRKPDAHKGNFGKCLITAGSIGFTGAAALTARAASRVGAGLVYLGVPESIYNTLAIKLDEEMVFPLPGDSDGKLSAKAAGEFMKRALDCDVVLMGPGMGTSPDISELVSSVIRLAKTPIVLDADALNAISNTPEILGQAAGPLILTPHSGEYLRLGGDLTSGDRLRSAREFAHKYGCILVLKGHRTITAMPDGTAFINTTGCPAMAKGGSGDVLSGMIAALIAQRFPIKEAVTAAVYIHGLAGEMCRDESGDYSVIAGDIISMLPKAMIKMIRD